jgi:exodeoxyribonuclease-1
LTEQKQATFLVHDYETFGINPAYDRPSQFAGVRTDEDFNIIGEPLVIYCKPADDYLPNPEAVILTGITPQHALRHGVNEAEFAKLIHQEFSRPATCIMGYNNIRFDDEVSRNVFYRNFYDPYAYSWQNKNSRWDLLDIVRACYALRPEGINWPTNDEGLPSFKLEHLTKANNIAHEHAHDAMSDVYATIEMAKLIKRTQPKLFDYLFQHRNKHKLAALIDIVNMTPLVHVSGMFGAYRGNTSWVAPLAWHPENKNAVIMCDLAGDITPLLTLTVDELKARLYRRREDFAENESRLPLKLVHINKCPVLAPAKTLLAENAERLGIDRQACLKNLQIVKEHPQIREKVTALFAEQTEFTPAKDVDGQLYNGFFSDADRSAMNIILKTSPENLPALDLSFNDGRIAELLFRYRARNYPNTLSDKEQLRWFNHRKEIFNHELLSDYIRQLDDLAQRYADNPSKLALIKSLYDYAAAL